jgi:hypothetical protein
MSNNTSSWQSSFLAMLSAQVAPTAPAPTTVTFIEQNLFVRKKGLSTDAVGKAKVGIGSEFYLNRQYL